MGALSRALTLALSVGLVGCTVKTMPIVGEPAASPQVAPASAPQAAEVVAAPDTREFGWLNLSVRWPQQDGYQVALLPTTTSALSISVKNNGVLVSGPTIVSREPGALKATASIRVEAANNLSVEIKAYRESNPNLSTAVAIAQKTGVVNVIRSKVTALALTLDPVNVPTVSAFNRNAGRVGDSITITGTNFGSGSVPTPTVTFNGTPATSVTRNSDTSLTVVVPTGATNGYVQVKADGVDSNSAAAFWVLSNLGITSATRDLWDTDTARYVRYGQSRAFNVQHAWSWKSSQDEINAVYGNPPVPSWSSTNATAGSFDQNGLFTAGNTTATSSVTAQIGTLISNALEVRSVGVDSVGLDQTSLTLNALPSDGMPDAGYVTEARLTATVVSSIPGDLGVTWSTSDASRATVSDTGLVQTVKDAPEGTVIITATSKEDSNKKATASVTVTILGDLELGIE